MAIINVLTYTGPFPVTGSYNPALSQIDDAGAPTHRLVSQQVVIPIAASSDNQLISPDTQTYTETVDGQINFVVDGNPVGNVVWDTGTGMPKWSLGGLLDPVAFLGTPQTIAQRNALVAVNPLSKRGWLVYVVDGSIREYQVWDGSAWQTVGGVTKVKETLTVVSRNTINPLSFTPLSPVEFVVNGIESSGVTNVGTAVSVNPSVVGFNIDPVDSVVATYLR